MLAKNRSPPMRQINKPGKVIASGWRRMSRYTRQLAEHRTLRVAGSIDQHRQRQRHAERDAVRNTQC